MKEAHEEELRDLIENHKKEIETLKSDAQDAKDLAEERLRMELKVNYIFFSSTFKYCFRALITIPVSLLSFFALFTILFLEYFSLLHSFNFFCFL